MEPCEVLRLSQAIDPPQLWLTQYCSLQHDYMFESNGSGAIPINQATLLMSSHVSLYSDFNKYDKPFYHRKLINFISFYVLCAHVDWN